MLFVHGMIFLTTLVKVVYFLSPNVIWDWTSVLPFSVLYNDDCTADVRLQSQPNDHLTEIDAFPFSIRRQFKLNELIRRDLICLYCAWTCSTVHGLLTGRPIVFGHTTRCDEIVSSSEYSTGELWMGVRSVFCVICDRLLFLQDEDVRLGVCVAAEPKNKHLSWLFSSCKGIWIWSWQTSCSCLFRLDHRGR